MYLYTFHMVLESGVMLLFMILPTHRLGSVVVTLDIGSAWFNVQLIRLSLWGPNLNAIYLQRNTTRNARYYIRG